ncbi:MAG TPA: type II toxin-antitoxin system VapC family toxin [Candidatus Angelobacter sp.]|nr:type II toxin-antitoxin system VapC family toxin [Candidatus Angelobacter sp.]
MSEFVLDASVASSWCFPGDPTEDTPYSRRILLKLATHDAVVPEIWAFEIANIIFVACSKRKRISQKQIDEYLQLLKALPIRVESSDIWTNVSLESRARKWNLSAYDAAYIDLALRRKLPLATADVDLKSAAAAEGIQVLG